MFEKIDVWQRVPLHEIDLSGNESDVDLSHFIQKLKLGMEKSPVCKVELDIDNDWDGIPERVTFYGVYKREETDQEHRERLAQERRTRASTAALAERNRARKILALQEQAKSLGFVIAKMVGK